MVKSQNKEIDHLFLYIAFGILILFIIVLVWRLPTSSYSETFVNPISNLEEIITDQPYKSNGNVIVFDSDFISKLEKENTIILNNTLTPDIYSQYKILGIKKNDDNETILQLDKPLDLPMTGKATIHKLLTSNQQCGTNTIQCINKNNQPIEGLCFDLKTRNTLSTNCDYEKNDCAKPDYIYDGVAYYVRSSGLSEECLLKNQEEKKENKEKPFQTQKLMTPTGFINQESELPTNMSQFLFESKNEFKKENQIGQIPINIDINNEEENGGQEIREKMENGNKKRITINPYKKQTGSKKFNLDNISSPSQIILNIGYNNKTDSKKKEDDFLIKPIYQEQNKEQPSILPLMMDTGFKGPYINYDTQNKNMDTQSKPFQYGNSYAKIDMTPEEVLPGLDLTPLASFEPLD